MPGRITAVEAIGPAFARTKRVLFAPFRLGMWARLAVVALITGEAGGGGGGGAPNLSGIGNLPKIPKTTGDEQWRMLARLLRESGRLLSAADWRSAAGRVVRAAEWKARAAGLFTAPGWEQVQPYLTWIVLCLAAVIALVLLWIYSDCVYRFILLDAVLTGECRLRAGWRKWRDRGREYFLWVLAFGFISLLAFGIVVGIPLWMAYNAGWLQKAGDHVGGLIGWGLLLGLLLIGLAITTAVIDLFARDFVIPVMAMENVDAIEAWRRLGGMLGAEKGAYALYVLLKIGFAIGAGILFTIVNLFAFLILLIPLGMVGLIVFLVGQALRVEWGNLSVIFLLAAAGLLGLAAVLYVVGLVYAPGLVFFQSFTLEFFAARYEPLARRMAPLVPPGSVPPAPPPPRLPANWVPRTPGDPFPAS